MSRYKKYKPPFEDRNKAGEKICIMCGVPLTGRKLKWCGERKCSQLVWVRSGDQSAMRRYLTERDKEICAECNLDLKTIKELDDILDWPHGEWINLLNALNIDPGYHMHYWEADHIIPVSEGGPHHEDNLQILCLNCHHKKRRRPELPSLQEWLFEQDGNI